MLDPHCGLKAKHKPLWVGITYQLPNGVENTPSNSATGLHTKNICNKQSHIKLDQHKPLDKHEIAVMNNKSSDICLAVQAYWPRSLPGTNTKKDKSMKSPNNFFLSPLLSNKNLLYLKELIYIFPRKIRFFLISLIQEFLPVLIRVFPEAPLLLGYILSLFLMRLFCV